MTTLPSSVTVNGQTVSIQWHHVINNASFEGSSFLQAIGWQQDSVARNLIPLASTTEGADLIGGARHSGGHPAYNSFIDFVVSAFDTAYRESNFGGLTQTQWLEQSAKKIDGFVSYLKVELKNPDSILKRHKDDLSAIDLDSKLWKGMESLFDPNTLEFHSPITSHSVYQGGLDNPGQYDATPGNGTALDITQGRTASQNAAAMASEFGLDSRPSNTGLLAHLAGLGHAFKGVLVVGGTALGVIGLYSDAAEAFEAADQLLAEGDPIGADAEVYGFAAKQLLSTSRLIASYAASDGSLADTLARNEQLTNEWAEAAKRAYIARTLADMAARGEAIPQKYDGFLTSGDAEVLADGTAVGHLDTGQSFEFSWSATGLSMTASDAQGNTVYAASLDAAGNATLLHSAPDASSVELFMQAGAEWPSFAESSPLGELIAVGDFVEGANGGPTIVSQQRATDGSGEPIGSWQTTVTKAPVDEQPVLVHPEPQIISGYQIGQAFGSALGQLIGGSNTFARIAAGSALGVVLGNVGETLQIYFNDTWVSGSAPPQNVTLAQAAELSFANFGAELASGFASAGLGAASAYLTAEPRHQCQRHRRAARTRMSTGVESLAFGRAPLR